MLILTEFIDHAEALLQALRAANADHEKAKLRIAELEYELRKVRAELDICRALADTHGG